MISIVRLSVLLGVLWPLLVDPIHAAATEPASRRDLQEIVDAAAAHALKTFAENKLQTNQLAISLVDLRDPQHPPQAHYRGDAPIYPPSVIKLFYLVAAHRWMEDGKLKDT